MRDYGKISPQFWTGTTGKQIKAAGPEAVIVALYLMTSPHANMIGLYYLPKIYIAHETGLSLEGAIKGLTRCLEASLCTYEDASEYVFVHAMARFQIADTLKPEDNRVKGIQNEVEKAPKGALLQAFLDIYSVPFNLKTPSPYEAPTKPRAGTGAGTGKRKAASLVGIDDWIKSLEGQDAIPADDPIFGYADKTGIPIDFLALSWRRFRETMAEQKTAKKDWRAHYRNAVKGNWYKIWWFDSNGACQLTTTGEQAKRAAA